jgi:hypothetical protein
MQDLPADILTFVGVALKAVHSLPAHTLHDIDRLVSRNSRPVAQQCPAPVAQLWI